MEMSQRIYLKVETWPTQWASTCTRYPHPTRLRSEIIFSYLNAISNYLLRNFFNFVHMATLSTALAVLFVAQSHPFQTLCSVQCSTSQQVLFVDAIFFLFVQQKSKQQLPVVTLYCLLYRMASVQRLSHVKILLHRSFVCSAAQRSVINSSNRSEAN